jgi:uncharacterized RDD family membrane protein YckC
MTHTPASTNSDTQPTTPSYSPPSIWRRIMAMVYEGMVLFGVVFFFGYVFDTLTQSRHGLVLRHERQLWLMMAMGLYFVWFWVKSGQTIALKTLQMQVGTTINQRITWSSACLRYVFSWLSLWPQTPVLIGFMLLNQDIPFWMGIPYPLGFAWCLIDKHQRTWHDLLSKTRLWYVPQLHGV